MVLMTITTIVTKQLISSDMRKWLAPKAIQQGKETNTRTNTKLNRQKSYVVTGLLDNCRCCFFR